MDKKNQKQIFLARSDGLTLLELLVAISILAISLMLSIPSIRTIVANNEIVTASNSIMSGYVLARSEAITRGNDVVICPSNNGNRCNNGKWNKGWIVFDDADGNGKRANNEVIRRSFSKTSLKRSGLTGNVGFRPDGTTTLGSSTSLTICYSKSYVSNKCQKISVNRFGLISSEEVTS